MSDDDIDKIDQNSEYLEISHSLHLFKHCSGCVPRSQFHALVFALFFCCFTPPVIPTTAGTSGSAASHPADPLVQQGTLQVEELKKNYFHCIFQ